GEPGRIKSNRFLRVPSPLAEAQTSKITLKTFLTGIVPGEAKMSAEEKALGALARCGNATVDAS
ncbi:hypothetical protein RUM43_002485, partial [Polyplax serrata]